MLKVLVVLVVGVLITIGVVSVIEWVVSKAAKDHEYDALDLQIDTETYVKRHKTKWHDIY